MTRQEFMQVLLGSMLFSVASKHSSAQAVTTPGSFSPVHEEHINKLESTAAALDVNQPNSFQDLASGVLGMPHFFSVPKSIANLAAPRLAQSEQAHMQLQHPGVHEHALVEVFNQTATALDAPTFAQVTASQVRFLRVRMLLTSPVFMGRGITQSDAKVGDSINPYLSPLQAVHLGFHMADQKVANELFQFEPAEWDAKHKVLLSQRRSSPGQSHFRAISPNSSGVELSKRVNSRVQSMPLTSQVSLATVTISALGL